ncbi:MAG: hypothetical protein J6K19_08090 [Prevotella sp.]|nr:hypothetical protein [Prevotella sp.]
MTGHKRVKRIAVHELLFGKETFDMCIIELKDGVVTGYYHFDEEQSMVEWIGGTAVLDYDGNHELRAYMSGRMVV